MNGLSKIDGLNRHEYSIFTSGSNPRSGTIPNGERGKAGGIRSSWGIGGEWSSLKKSFYKGES